MFGLDPFEFELRDDAGVVPDLFAQGMVALDCSSPPSPASPGVKRAVPDGEGGVVTVEAEQRIVRNLLLRMFNPDMTASLLSSFYAQSPHTPVFHNAAASLPPACGYAGAAAAAAAAVPTKPPVAKPQLRFHVSGFATTHFAKDPFPPFTARLVHASGDPLSRGTFLPDVRVRLSVLNRWADVSAEVVPGAQLSRVLREGCLEVNDLVFHDVSLKHGGFFVVSLQCESANVPFTVEPWESDRFVIQSVKTHCNKKKKGELDGEHNKGKDADAPRSRKKRKSVDAGQL